MNEVFNFSRFVSSVVRAALFKEEIIMMTMILYLFFFVFFFFLTGYCYGRVTLVLIEICFYTLAKRLLFPRFN